MKITQWDERGSGKRAFLELTKREAEGLVTFLQGLLDGNPATFNTPTTFTTMDGTGHPVDSTKGRMGITMVDY